jgi:post-segregation antitoxin (ccd killing protein)
VVADELDGDLAALAGQLLAAVAVVFDKALRAEARHHLADAWRRDAEAVSEVARGHGSLVAVELVEGFEVILLRPGECAATLELLDQVA